MAAIVECHKKGKEPNGNLLRLRISVLSVLVTVLIERAFQQLHLSIGNLMRLRNALYVLDLHLYAFVIQDLSNMVQAKSSTMRDPCNSSVLIGFVRFSIKTF